MRLNFAIAVLLSICLFLQQSAVIEPITPPGVVPMERDAVTTPPELMPVISRSTRAISPNLAAWISQGPSAIQGGTSVEGLTAQKNPVIGAIKCAAINPADANTMFIGTVNGGIWKSSNAAAVNPSWTPVTDTLPQSIGDIKYDPADTNNKTLVAGIGRTSADANIGGDRTGILRTTDGGVSWTNLGQTPLNDRNIVAVAVRGSIILVGAANAGTGVGVYRSADSGATWSFLSDGVTLPVGNATDVAVDPSFATIFYAGISGTSGGFFRSIDSGVTWTKVNDAAMSTHFTNNNPTNVKLYISSVNTYVMAVVGSNNKLSAVFRTTNQGNTNWTSLPLPTTGTKNIGIHTGGQGQIHLGLTSELGDNKDSIYIGGDRQPSTAEENGSGNFPNSLGANDFSGRIFRYSVSGGTWTAVTNNKTKSNTSPHADCRGLFLDVNGNLVDVCDGGIYQLSAPTTSTGDWSGRCGNLNVSEVHSAAYDGVSNIVVGGLQDNGANEQTTTGSTTWSQVNGGDGSVTAVDDVGVNSIRYTSSQSFAGFTRRTLDSGNNLLAVSNPQLNISGGGNIATDISADTSLPLYNPYKVNRVASGRMIIGTQKVYESTDMGDTFTNLGSLGSPVVGIAYGGSLNGVANPNALYVTTASKVFVRTSGTGAPAESMAFTTIAAGLNDITGIAMDQNDYRIAFVCTAGGTIGANGGKVFFTTDAGATWTNIKGDLPISNLNCIETMTSASVATVVMVGGTGSTAAGPVFACGTGTFGQWVPLGTNIPSRGLVKDLHYNPKANVLLACAFGRGVYTIPKASAALFGVAPTFTNNPLTAKGAVGQVFTPYTLTAIGTTPITFTASPLPAGLTFDGTTISGTPTTTGVTNVTLTASNGASPDDSKTLVITITAAPLITSALTATATVGKPFNYSITATGTTPITFTASPLPNNLTFSGSTISGTPSATGTTNVTLTAANGTLPNDSKTLVITTVAAPLITSALTATGTMGQAFSYTVTASGTTPITFTASPLPSGLTFSGATLSGTPTAPGTYNVTLTAANAGTPSDSKVLVVTIKPAAPLITSALTATGNVGQPFSYTITVSGSPPISVSLSSLPAGLTLNGGTISGTPTTPGTTNVALTASNGTLPDDSKTLVITIVSLAPVFDSAPTATPSPASAGQSVSFTASASGAIPLTYVWDFGDGSSATTANVSHSFSPAKTYTVTVTVSDSNGASASSTLTLVVNAAVGGDPGSGPAVPVGEIDTDGDGYSDNIEIALGTDPNDATDSPAGTDGVPTLQPVLSPLFKLTTKTHSLTLSGALHIPKDFVSLGQKLAFNAGGYTRTFALDGKGAGKNGKDTFKMTIKLTNKKVLEQNAKFKMTLTSVPATVKSDSAYIIVIGGDVFSK